MADRFWVGNGGSWSSSSHWSETSGGPGGASVPTTVDNVYFDVNSFNTTGQVVTVSIIAYCLNMDWTGALYNPTFGISDNFAVCIYGSLTLITDMDLTGSSWLIGFYSSSPATITTAGNALESIYFFGSSGEWTLQDDLTVDYLYHNRGILNSNNKNINCCDFYSNTSYARTLNLGSSIITCSGDIIFYITYPTLDAGTSTFIMTGSNKTFNGGDKSFYNLELQGDLITIIGSNTFNDLKLTAGKTVNITAGTTQIITDMSGDGITDSYITIQSTSAGSQFTLSKASGLILVEYYSIKDCVATGGARFKNINGVNISGNSGWVFRDYDYPVDITGRSTIISLFEAVQDCKSKLINKIAQVQAEDKVSAFIADTFNPTIADLQSQVDGQISVWFYGYEPTLLLPPVADNPDPNDDWSTDAIKDTHLGDLFYNTVTGYGYRFAYSSGTYQWITVDTDVASALAAAQTAQDTADGKRRVFVVTPTVPYDVGDLWTSGISGDILKCKTAKTAAQTYSVDDWEPATAVGSWIYNSVYEATVTFDGKNIQANTITANHIKADELHVGGKVGAGYLGTYIGNDGIYTGTIQASQIVTENLYTERIYQPGCPNSYAVVGGTMGDLILYYDDVEWFRVYNSVNTCSLKYKSHIFLESSTTKATPIGEWDFGGATVTRLYAQWG